MSVEDKNSPNLEASLRQADPNNGGLSNLKFLDDGAL
jgi:hypothetical protein